MTKYPLMKAIYFTFGVLIIGIVGTGILLAANKSSSRLLIGDSIAAGWSLPDTFNGGVGGSTSDDVLYNWRQKYRDGEWRTVIVLVGTNDIGAGMSFDGFKDHIKQLLWSTEMKGSTQLILCSILPVKADYHEGKSADVIYNWNQWLKEFSADNNLTYLDFYRAMVDGKYLRTDLSDDGIHPNTAGYAIMTEILREIEG